MRLMDLNVVVFWNKVKTNQYSCIQEINNIFGNTFDMTPIINTIPDLEKLPLEIPVVVMNSSSGAQSISINVKQAGLTIHSNIYEESDVDDIISAQGKNIRNFINYFADIEKIVRIGFVVNCFENRDSSAKVVMEKYSKTIIPRCEEFSIRYNQKSEVGSLSINNIYNISNAQIEYAGKKETGILVSRDINNKPTDDSLCQKDIENLSKFAFAELTSKKIKELI